MELMHFEKDSRLLVVAPHPDDETLAAGGLIQEAQASGSKVHILYLTSGERNLLSCVFYNKKIPLSKPDFHEIGQIRRQEAVRAMRVLGLGEGQFSFLDYPDGKLSKDDSLVLDFKRTLISYRPTHVCVTSALDSHPDHKATYIYFNKAISQMDERWTHPKVYGYLIHFNHGPINRHLPSGQSVLDYFFENKVGRRSWYSHLLSTEQMRLKKKALLEYKTQTAYNRNFILSFVQPQEFFMEIPSVVQNRQAVLVGE